MSFFIYLFNALTVAFFVQFASKNKNKIIRFLSLGIAILVPSLIAGLRDVEVGTDSITYAENFWLLQYGESTRERWNEFEPGYSFLNNIIANLGFSYSVLFFAMQFLTMLFFVKAVWNERDNIIVWLTSFTYMLLYFQTSLNMVRQALSITICIFAITLLLKNKKMQFLVWVLVASLFHFSALICLSLFILKYFFEKREKLSLLILIGASMLISNRDLLGNIVYVITGSGYFAGYITRDAEDFGSMSVYILRCGAYIVFPLFIFHKMNFCKKYKFYLYTVILGFIIGSLGRMTMTQVQRVGYYFSYLLILLIPLSISYMRRGNKAVAKIAFCLLLLFAWYYDFFYKGFNDTVPYKTTFSQ